MNEEVASLFIKAHDLTLEDLTNDSGKVSLLSENIQTQEWRIVYDISKFNVTPPKGLVTNGFRISTSPGGYAFCLGIPYIFSIGKLDIARRPDSVEDAYIEYGQNRMLEKLLEQERSMYSLVMYLELDHTYERKSHTATEIDGVLYTLISQAPLRINTSNFSVQWKDDRKIPFLHKTMSAATVTVWKDKDIKQP